jgi:hypothetical protein
MCDVTFPPLTDGVAVAADGIGDLLIGRLPGLCGSQDDPTTQGERLRCGAGANQGGEGLTLLGGKLYGGCERTRLDSIHTAVGEARTQSSRLSCHRPDHWRRTYETVI